MANIQHWLEQIRRAIYGREVRSSIADAIEEINKEQSHLDGVFDQLIINAGNSNAEVVAARVKADSTQFNTLGERLNNNDEDLLNLSNNFDALNQEVIEARTDRNGVDHGRLNVRLDNIDEQLDTITEGVYCDNTQDINIMNDKAVSNNQTLIIKSGEYVINDTVILTSNIHFEKNVVFKVTSNIDGVVIHPNGQSIDFNGLKIIVDVANYTNIALTIRGFKYINEEDMSFKNAYSFIGNVTVHNNKTTYPYTNASGTGICVKIEDKEIFMWTKFRLYSSQFENGIMMLSTAQSDPEAFVSSCDFDLVSWRNTNSVVVNDMNNSGWNDLRIKLKNQPAQNQVKIIKNIKGGIKTSWVDVALWDMQVVSGDYIVSLIDGNRNAKNKYTNTLDDGTNPIQKYINYSGNSVYFPIRNDNVMSKGNIIVLNAWDYIYCFGKDVESTDSFVEASNKIIENANKLKHNTNIIIELSFFNNTSYSEDLWNKTRAFVPEVPNQYYGFGKLKITLNCYNATFNSVCVEFISHAPTSINMVSYQAIRTYDKSGNDSLWTIYGDLFVTTEQRNNLSTEIRLPQGFKIWDKDLGKPIFNIWGVWKDALGNNV